MKKLLIIIFALSVTFHSACSKSQSNQSENPFSYNTLEVVKKEVKHFKELGRISRAIKLETTEDALIGEVSHVMIDDITQDILVADFRSSKKVFRFNKEGRFITSYGKLGEGPGEYEHLRGFAPCPNGDIVLISIYKIMKFSREGVVLSEKRLDYFPNDITIIDDLLYISIWIFRRNPQGKNAIVILNMDFEFVNQIGDYDSRLEKYAHLFARPIANRGKDLYFLDFYDFNLNVFKTDLKKMYKITVPNDNKELDSTWSKKRLSKEDATKISKRIHRFIGIFSFNNGLILPESCREKNIMNLWMLNLIKKKAYIFPHHSMCRNYQLKFQPDLFFDWIAGSYENGVIGVLDNVDEFNAYKGNYPALKNLSLNTEENSILVFFEFDMDKIEKLKNE